MDYSIFETLLPFRYHTFYITNEVQDKEFYTDELKIAVLDSPEQLSDPPHIAAMVVPSGLEDEWLFNTRQGHLQLLLELPKFSRLVLVGNRPFDNDEPCRFVHASPFLFTPGVERLEYSLFQEVKKCCPNSCRFSYLNSAYDEVVCRFGVFTCMGDVVGQIMVDDVEILNRKFNGRREFWRRMTFKTSPIVIQTQVPLLPEQPLLEQDLSLYKLGAYDKVHFIPQIPVLIDSYLEYMIMALSLVAQYLDDKILAGVRHTCLCMGVGGGALVNILNGKLDFEIVGVEVDGQILKLGPYFGMIPNQFVRLVEGDAIQLIKDISNLVSQEWIELSNNYRELKGEKLVVMERIQAKFDVIMVDLCPFELGLPIMAPTSGFADISVFQAAKKVLNEGGVMVINVLPPDPEFYNGMVNDLRQVFRQIYEINVPEQRNYIIIATSSSVRAATENTFLARLRSIVSIAEDYSEYFYEI